MNEFEIIIKIKNGDIKTFEKVFRDYYEMLCKYAATIVKDYDLAEELVQNIFYNIWKKHSTLDINSTLKGYLIQCTKNQCLQHLKHKQVELKYADKIKQEFKEKAISVTDELVTKEIAQTIDKTLNNLPDKCREIFSMSRFEGLKYHEIADKLSISIKTVEAYMGKALKSFRDNLAGYSQVKV